MGYYFASPRRVRSALRTAIRDKCIVRSFCDCKRLGESLQPWLLSRCGIWGAIRIQEFIGSGV